LIRRLHAKFINFKTTIYE